MGLRLCLMTIVPQHNRRGSLAARAMRPVASCLLHHLPRSAGGFLLLLLVAGPAPGWAESDTRVLFGPEKFVRTASPPDRFERIVTVPSSTRSPVRSASSPIPSTRCWLATPAPAAL